jgi:hypothetical protein
MPSEEFQTLFTLLRRDVGGTLGFDIEMDRRTSEIADPQLSATDPSPTARLFEIDAEARRITIYPVNTIPKSNFLKPRYHKIRSLVIDLYESTPLPTDETEALAFLSENLLSAFIKDPIFGLGLMKEMRPLISSIEELPNVSSLAILADEATRLDGATFYLSHGDYEDIRLAFQRVARKYQDESLRDRKVIAHNETLHKILPSVYGEKHRPYVPGTIVKLLGGNAKDVKLRGRDRHSIVDAVTKNAKSIASNDPKEFIQLQKDIELVSLDALIESFRQALERNRAEKAWQELFELNPFILSMVFGYPAAIVEPTAFVGGITLQGSGNKIADFLMKNSGTNNAALVEIKVPQAKLLGEEYRTGVWAPSKELTGAVTQVLDQRQKFTTGIAQIKHNSGNPDLQAYSVDCVIIIGRTPEPGAQASSFELYRSQFKDVRIVTFDELLEKLLLLRELLSSDRYEAAQPGDADVEELSTELDGEEDLDEDGEASF